MKGKLYCVCDKAEKDVCEKCPKNKILKPDVKLNCPTWKRSVKDFAAMVYARGLIF